MIWQKLASRICRSCGIKSFAEIALALKVNTFYTEIKGGCQKWRENNFGKNSPVESVDPLGSKILSKSL